MDTDTVYDMLMTLPSRERGTLDGFYGFVFPEWASANSIGIESVSDVQDVLHKASFIMQSLNMYTNDALLKNCTEFISNFLRSHERVMELQQRKKRDIMSNLREKTLDFTNRIFKLWDAISTFECNEREARLYVDILNISGEEIRELNLDINSDIPEDNDKYIHVINAMISELESSVCLEVIEGLEEDAQKMYEGVLNFDTHFKDVFGDEFARFKIDGIIDKAEVLIYGA